MSRRRIAIVTGSRAEYGLLRPVIRAAMAHRDLETHLVVAGAHLLPPAMTIDEVRSEFPIAATVQMQLPESSGRLGDAAAFGRGAVGFAATFERLAPDVVLVLGDRIEAFAAASAAAIGGLRVAHIHGGDRAEGVADEGMRHAITKLAHVHLPASARSVERILCLGEEALRVHLVGSPAVDGIESIPPMDEAEYAELGRPEIAYLLHGQGRSDEDERIDARLLLDACERHGRVVIMHPNHDPGREAILSAISTSRSPVVAHLPREKFIALLRRVKLLVGNSSSALIECAVLRVRCVNVGTRQAGREKPVSVFDVPDWDPRKIDVAISRALSVPLPPYRHPYGDGRAGMRTAQVLATFDESLHPVRKRNSY